MERNLADRNDDSKCEIEENIPRRRSSSVTGNPRPVKAFSYEDRKNSNSDLHSRLKTRKVLGVGEIRDDGDIYRSKISQILGHSEHLYVKLPKGLVYWQTANVTYFFGSGLLCLIVPNASIPLEIVFCSPVSISETLHPMNTPIRFYGAALIGFCVLYRGLMVTRERSHIASGLLGSSIVFGLQSLVALPWVWSCRNNITTFQLLCFGSKVIFGIIGNYIYYEVTSASSSSFSSIMNRILRRFGMEYGQGDMGRARTPVMSNYNIAGDGDGQGKEDCAGNRTEDNADQEEQGKEKCL